MEATSDSVPRHEPRRDAGVSNATRGSQVLRRTPSPGGRGLSLLLARAFLDAQEWEREELMRTGSLVLGARRRWLGPLVRATLAGYPRRPGGGPRELARWIAAQAPFTEALDKAYSTGRPISVAHHLLEDAVGQALRTPHLPQGAPSSPALANLSVRRLDARLQGWAEAAGGRYTRYADDLAFSGPLGLAHRSAAFVRGVERIVAAEGHAVNQAKTRVRRAGARQTVTGIVVNEHTSVTRSEYDALKATLHNCLAHGPESQRRSRSDLRAHLTGRVAWVESLDPRRGGLLRAALDRIEWP